MTEIWVFIQALILPLERYLHFPILGWFFYYYYFLCLLFVIYLEAETFSVGKSLLYILKVINMSVPWLPAGLQNP